MKLDGFDTGSPFPDWDISLDDQRFLIVMRAEGDERPRAALTVVINWF